MENLGNYTAGRRTRKLYPVDAWIIDTRPLLWKVKRPKGHFPELWRAASGRASTMTKGGGRGLQAARASAN